MDKQPFQISSSSIHNRLLSKSEPADTAAIAEITNVSVEISPKIIIAGELPQEESDLKNFSPLS